MSIIEQLCSEKFSLITYKINMKTNEDLQRDVQDAIKWEPLLHAAEIGVTVKDGIVTLTGTVDSFAKKLEAEYATKNVVGVKAIVEKIKIKFLNSVRIDDSALASNVLRALSMNWSVPNSKIKIKVEDGWVSLEGALSSYYQKDAAHHSVNQLEGVKGISNLIKVQPDLLHDIIEKKDIERAFLRNWTIDQRNIEVNVEGNHVTLSGNVGSLYQKDEAGRIARNAPGVVSLDNELQINVNSK